jgi:hypothetical protein
MAMDNPNTVAVTFPNNRHHFDWKRVGICSTPVVRTRKWTASNCKFGKLKDDENEFVVSVVPLISKLPCQECCQQYNRLSYQNC